MKDCFKCGETKPLDAFYKHPKMADGHVNKCIECNKKDVRDNRASKLDYYKAYDAERFKNDPKVLERHKRYQATPEGKLAAVEARQKWLSNNADKHAAHIILANAVRSGRKEKPTNCSICGSDGKLHGHHDDYTKPLDVVWCCPKCHYRIHHPLRK